MWINNTEMINIKGSTTMTHTLALDLEGTLISNSFSIIPRPGLYDFLYQVYKIFDEIVIFTAVKQNKFIEVASQLIIDGYTPSWFNSIKYIDWNEYVYKDLRLINEDISKVLIVDDYIDYIQPDQRNQWIPIKLFHHPYSSDDNELEKTLDILKLRAIQNFNNQ